MKIIIFCGGYGTRMWPASRKSYPKQFFPLLKGKSFFQTTVERFSKKFDVSDIFVSTESKYKDFILTQAPNIPQENIILEPERRDNLAAIGLAVSTVHARFPNEVVFFSWCDHIIKNENKFCGAVKAACDYCAQTGVPVSIDQEPTFPTVHSGWVKVGKYVGSIAGKKLFEIEKHIEKPNLQTAKKLFRSSKYAIHTGYGAWRTDVLLGYYDKYAHQTYKSLMKISHSYGKKDYDTILKSEYSKIEKISIDFGLFEKIPARTRLTMRSDFGWQDVGTWQLMFESLSEGADSNHVEGDIKTRFIESNGNLIVGSNNKMISIIGLSNIVVVDTPNGLLVSSLDKTSKVKELFSQLEKEDPVFVE